MAHFFDSSAFAKMFIEERGSKEVVELFNQRIGKHSSALLWVEVRAAIRRRQRIGDIEARNADRMIVALDAQKKLVQTLEMSQSILDEAAGLVDSQQLRSLDAVQLATALSVLEVASELIFVSADRQLLDAASRVGLAVIDVESTA